MAPEGTNASQDSAVGLSAESLLSYVVTKGVISGSRLVSMLGESRHALTLNKLELALARESVISTAELLEAKSALAGLPALEGFPWAIPVIPSEVARRTGSLVLTEEPLVAAMVDPRPELIHAVEQSIGRTGLQVRLITAPQFSEAFRVTYSGGAVDDRPEVTDIYTVFDEAVRKGASDIHLSVGQPVVLRVDGVLHKLAYREINERFMDRLLTEIAGPERLAEARKSFQSDFAYPFGVARFRCNIGMNSVGLTLTARALPTRVPTSDELALPAALRQFTELERGLVLVTGQTGSGKSTTLAALLAQIATEQSRHIITLEDPIEFVLPCGRGHVDQRQLGSNFSSFPQGLRQALRQDPDVILVGELRDWDTMGTALAAAETGHLVFGTLHTHSAEQTLGRLVSAAPSEEQDQVRAALSYILKGVVSQVLLPSSKGKGRVAAFEVMVGTTAIANNLRKVDGAAALRQVMEVSQDAGMQTMDMALADLVLRGLVTEGEAAYRARDLTDFQRRIGASRK
jgi:twitching motility protein PilT